MYGVFALLLLWMRQELKKTGYWFCALAKFFYYGTKCTAIFVFFFGGKLNSKRLPKMALSPSANNEDVRAMKNINQIVSEWFLRNEIVISMHSICFKHGMHHLRVTLYFHFWKSSRSTIKYRNKTNELPPSEHIHIEPIHTEEVKRCLIAKSMWYSNSFHSTCVLIHYECA